MQYSTSIRGFVMLTLSLLAIARAYADYGGTPFHGQPISVPGTVEAEDYDKGGEGVGYQWGTAQGGDRSYRHDAKGVGGGGSGHNLGWTDNGVWTRYTVNVIEAGDYRIDAVVSSGVDNGMFDFKVDGVTACRIQRVQNRGWDNYYTLSVEGIHLTEGEHVVTFNCYGGMNADKFCFVRTGDLTGNYDGGSYTYSYPMTQTYNGNPLFVDFPSPMFGQEDGFPGTMYTADPTARVWNIDGEEELFVYCSHDMEPAVGCDRMDRYHVYSTKDMHQWTDHGEILKADDVNRQFGFTCPGFMWAPDCVYNPNDHLYYYYFPHPTDGNDWGGSFRIFVATSSNPATGFQVKKVIEGLPPRIDPNVFVDDDGQPYIYVGGGAHVYGCKLKRDDWTTLDGTPVEMSGMEDFHEGAWVFKHEGRYYLSYPDNFSPNRGGNRMRWATASHPLGPWTPGGIYMNPHGEETAHGSVVKFKGQYYQFYHTGNYSGNGTLRTVCVDPLYFKTDGGIELVHNWGTPFGGRMPRVTPGYCTVIEAEHYNEGGSHYGYFMRPVEQPDGRKVVPEPVVEQRGDITCLSRMNRKEWTRYSVYATATANYTIRLFAARENDGDCGFWLLVDGVVAGSRADQYKERSITSAVGKFEEISFSNVHLTEGEHFIELRPMTGVISFDRIEIGKVGEPLAIGTVRQDRPADGSFYTMAGVRVENPCPGIYVCNGKKVIR